MLRRYDEKAAAEEAGTPDPEIILYTDKTDFYEFTIDDFKIRNYKAMKPQLALDLGI